MEAKEFEKRIELLQDANSAKNLTLGGGLPYETDGDARRLA